MFKEIKNIAQKEFAVDFELSIGFLFSGRCGGKSELVATKSLTEYSVNGQDYYSNILNNLKVGIIYETDKTAFLCKCLYNFFEIDTIFDFSFIVSILEELKSSGVDYGYPFKEIYNYNLGKLKNYRMNLSQYKTNDSKKVDILSALDLRIIFLEKRLRTYERDIEMMTRTVYGEARGSKEDHYPVACVLRNRNHLANIYVSKYQKIYQQYGIDDIASTCIVKYQFSCWNENDINYHLMTSKELMSHLHGSSVVAKALTSCWFACQKAYWFPYGIADPTNGATHYHCKTISPKWSIKVKSHFNTKPHFYYKGINPVDEKLIGK